MRIIPKIIFSTVIVGLIAALLFMPIGDQQPETKQIKIVATIFPAYDFSRTISADTDVDLKLLINPGTDLHGYEPTPQDIIDIKASDIFIYNGGESETWVSKIIDEIDKNKTTIVRMMDYVELKAESDDGHDYDEHVWTSPNNVIKISEAIAQAIDNYNPSDTAIVQHNLNEFKTKLESLDADFRKLAEDKTGTLIVADRFPFRYFIAEYGFDYIAAFPGCSEQAEASSKTVTELIKKANQNPTKIIFKLELSSGKVAQTVANSTKSKILTWHSVHNLSQSDFDAGKTYLDFMQDNYQNLNEALHDRTAD